MSRKFSELSRTLSPSARADAALIKGEIVTREQRRQVRRELASLRRIAAKLDKRIAALEFALVNFSVADVVSARFEVLTRPLRRKQAKR